MGRLVGDLLTLARLDESRPLERDPVELVGLALESVQTARLMGGMPAGVIVVSESGIAAAEQLDKLQRAGVAAVLVGESLMRAADAAAALRALQTFSNADDGL